MDSIQFPYITRQAKYRAFEGLLSEEWAMLLDSGSIAQESNGNMAENYRRYDILVFQPSVRLCIMNNETAIESNSENNLVSVGAGQQKPLQTMRDLLTEYSPYRLTGQSKTPKLDLPFCGGWMGYISYDYGRNQEFNSQIQRVDSSQQSASLPEIQMGLYQWALITDHQEQSTTVHNFGLEEKAFLLLGDKIKNSLTISDDSDIQLSNAHKLDDTHNSFELRSKFKSNISLSEYAKSFDKIQDYIFAGDCYQVNFAQQFKASYSGSSFSIYKALTKENNTPFSAYLNFGSQQILSLSPERFIESHQNQVKTQPIKGTRPRSIIPEQDAALAEELVNSEKDKAENLMIVDLLRNDLSKTAAKGSVRVTELFGLFRFESVHHLISTVTSTLKRGLDNFDLLATTLPGGSITGAPKIRAMEIIDELETFNRGIYCGVIGYLDFEGNMDTNICIRTLLADKTHLYCCAGGGIVADSVMEKEYQETFDKLNKILPILNQYSQTEISGSVS